MGTSSAAADPGADAAATTLNPVEVSTSLDRLRNRLAPAIRASQHMIEQLPLGDAAMALRLSMRAR
ncbi:MAG: hypothetical protein ACREPT_04985 [Rudaea sp.]